MASVFLLHRLVKPDSMHVLHAMHGVRPVELQVDPELQLVAAFTMVNPKRPCEEKEGVRKGRQGGHAGGVLGRCSGGQAWELTREDTALGDTWERHLEIHACWEMQRGDAGELSSADRLLTCLKDRADAAFPFESTQVPESHPITYLRRGGGA